ncbi:peroxin Pex14 isoform X2 [Zea mays]|uniref:Peroxisomal membrane protein PEX14 n=2 Tax=Zea mays TaxID=4577 RepID=A0A804PUE3_MAIZE|nr:peroxin Pex14 isoform X2 [Zea mays]|eukprot:XP_008647885.1 peroxin Pex14 isoform X2 [Zea mays]
MASGTGSGQPQPAAADADPGAGDNKLVFETPLQPQPVREDYVENAVKFLSHPKVRGSPVVYRRSFLEKKGLTTQEIDEALRRVPDPEPITTATASPQQQVGSQNQSAGAQTYAPARSMHPATAGPVVRPRFSWYQAFLAAGLLLGFGASTAVFIKKLFLPRLKSWIRNVVAQGDGAEGNQLKHRIDEETAEAVKASASAVSAIAKTNQQLLASKDEEKKILVTLTQALDSQAKELKSLTESINRTREPINITRDDRFSQHRPLEDHVPPVTRNGAINSSWRSSQQTNMYGVSHGDFGSAARSASFVPAPAEPTAGSFSRSCAETSTAAQRADRSSGGKPWEMQQYSQQRPGYGSNSQLNDDGSYSDAQDSYAPSYYQNGKAPDFQSDEPRSLTYNTGIEERPPPPQRRWVPPQPPGVAMPEAAAAIRQPKVPPKQPSSDASRAAGEMQVNGASSASPDAVTEVPVNSATTSDAGHSEIEEQPVAV